MPDLSGTCRTERNLKKRGTRNAELIKFKLEKYMADMNNPLDKMVPIGGRAIGTSDPSFEELRWREDYLRNAKTTSAVTLKDREVLARKTFAQCLDLLDKKGMSYSGGQDVNRNFKENGQRLGLSKYQIWAVYANKHVDSINNAIKSNPEKPVDHSESLEGRVIDMINYGICLLALLEEDK